MKILAPITMNDPRLISSTVPETDYSEWSSATTYAAGDFVIKANTHTIYQSVIDGNVGQDPETATSYWVEHSATNRWKAFDGKLADRVRHTGLLQYKIQPNGPVNAVALFNVGATQVRVRVYDYALGTPLIYDQTKTLVDLSGITDYISLFTTNVTGKTEAVFEGFTASGNNEIRIDIGDGTGPVSVGEVVVGRAWELGETLERTLVSFKSFSVKEQDDFGNFTVVPRANSRPIEFLVKVDPTTTGELLRVLGAVSDMPVVAYTDETWVDRGVLTYGYLKDFEFEPRNQGIVECRVKILALT